MASVRSPRGSRVKGANGEREFRDVIRSFGFRAERDGQTRVARFHGEPNLDVRHDIPGVHVEVKRREQYDIGPWIAQAEWDAEKESEAVGAHVEPWVAFRKNKQPWRCIVRAEWLLRLVREVIELRDRVAYLERFEPPHAWDDNDNVCARPRHGVPGHVVRRTLAEHGIDSINPAEEWALTHGVVTPAGRGTHIVAIVRGKRALVDVALADEIAVALGISPHVWYTDWAEWRFAPDEDRPVEIDVRTPPRAGDRVVRRDDLETTGTFLWPAGESSAVVDFGGDEAVVVPLSHIVRAA